MTNLLETFERSGWSSFKPSPIEESKSPSGTSSFSKKVERPNPNSWRHLRTLLKYFGLATHCKTRVPATHIKLSKTIQIHSIMLNLTQLHTNSLNFIQMRLDCVVLLGIHSKTKKLQAHLWDLARNSSEIEEHTSKSKNTQTT